MHDYLLKLFFLNIKYILYFVNEINNYTNFFRKFISIYLFYIVYFIFKNYLSNSNVNFLFNFKIIS